MLIFWLSLFLAPPRLTVMFKLVASAFVSLLLAASAYSAPQAGLPEITDPPAGFNVTSFGLNGSGCPPGSAYYLLNDKKSAVTVTFSQYYAEVGPGIPISHNRKNCQLTFGLSIPPGFTFGVAYSDVRGYYQLDNKVSATQRNYYYFQGQLDQSTATETHVGPVNGAYYTYRAPFDLVFTNTAPCNSQGTVLNIATSIQASNVDNKGGSGYIATDSVDSSLIHTFHFQWQTCR